MAWKGKTPVQEAKLDIVEEKGNKCKDLLELSIDQVNNNVQ